MTNTPTCPDCQRLMEVGFIPDALSGAMWRCQWHPGPAQPQYATFFGMNVGGKQNIEADLTRAVPITAFRCADCGLLKLYAPSAKGEAY